MSVDSAIFWLFVAAWVVVGGIFIVLILPRIVTQGLRIVRRVAALVTNSDLPLRIAKAESDLKRISALPGRAPGLIFRAEAAFTVIREHPLVPPNLENLSQTVRRQLIGYRSASRR